MHVSKVTHFSAILISQVILSNCYDSQSYANMLKLTTGIGQAQIKLPSLLSRSKDTTSTWPHAS